MYYFFIRIIIIIIMRDLLIREKIKPVEPDFIQIAPDQSVSQKKNPVQGHDALRLVCACVCVCVSESVCVCVCVRISA